MYERFDEAKFNQALNDYQPFVYRYAFLFRQDVTDSSKITKQVFSVYYHGGRNQKTRLPYFFYTTMEYYIGRRNTYNPREKKEEEHPVNGYTKSYHSYSRTKDIDIIRNGIAKRNKKVKITRLLYYFASFRKDKIASERNRSLKQVDKCLEKGCKILKKDLDRNNVHRISMDTYLRSFAQSITIDRNRDGFPMQEYPHETTPTEKLLNTDPKKIALLFRIPVVFFFVFSIIRFIVSRVRIGRR